MLSAEADGAYIGRVEKPEKGWTAYFVELTFATGGKYPLKFTTGARITPDTLPFPAPAPTRNIDALSQSVMQHFGPRPVDVRLRSWLLTGYSSTTRSGKGCR